MYIYIYIYSISSIPVESAYSKSPFARDPFSLPQEVSI